MAWSTPKTDWDPSDVLASTDFNRIEENTNVLRNTKHISAMLPNLWTSADYDDRIYSTYIMVPAGKTLLLRSIGLNAGTATPADIDIGIDGETAYNPTTATGEITGLSFTLYTNLIGTDQQKLLYIDYPSPLGNPYPWDPGAAFHMVVEIIDTP
jgi:hypothetical protein